MINISDYTSYTSALQIALNQSSLVKGATDDMEEIAHIIELSQSNNAVPGIFFIIFCKMFNGKQNTVISNIDLLTLRFNASAEISIEGPLELWWWNNNKGNKYDNLIYPRE